MTRPPLKLPHLGYARANRIAWAVLAALAVAFTVALLAGQGSGTASGRLGGDYPAFYSAGRIVNDGDAAHLYEPARQSAAQRDLFAGDTSGFLAFAYPPPVALAYAPLARLPYRLSYFLVTCLMLGAVGLALHLIEPMVRDLRHSYARILALSLTFFPGFAGVMLGQNTALTILVLAATWRLLHDDRDLAAGLVAGLALCKPQLGGPLLFLVLVAGRWRAMAGAAVTAVGLWAAGAVICGVAWPRTWLEQANAFGDLDAAANKANAVSLLGVAQAIRGVDDLAANVIGWGLAALVVASLVRTWRHFDRSSSAACMGAAAAGIVLLSPHTMWYDAGLLIVTGCGLLATATRRQRRWLLALWALGYVHLLSGIAGVSPLIVVAVGGFVFATRIARQQQAPMWPRPAFIPSPAAVDLSVIVPAYNEAGRIEPTLADIAEYLHGRPGTAEVLVVDDGSTDDTAARVTNLASDMPMIRLVALPQNRGKGAAVRAGMLAATGHQRVFLDADGSTHIAELDRLLAAAARRTHPPDIVIGSIGVRGREVTHAQSALRSRVGQIGNLVIQLLVLPGIRDSQRGFKVFSAEAAEAVFAHTEIDGWGFDVEALALARAYGFSVLEVGVRWEHHADGHVRSGAYVSSLREVWTVRRRVGLRGPQRSPQPASSG